MKLIKSSQQLVETALDKIRTLPYEEAIKQRPNHDVLFVDIRDIRELEREGTIPNALHAPRGMLEFWVDPESPYFKSVFSEKEHYILFCQSGWRSALATATLQDMGMDNISHIEGGFKNWKKSGGAIASIKSA